MGIGLQFAKRISSSSRTSVWKRSSSCSDRLNVCGRKCSNDLSKRTKSWCERIGEKDSKKYRKDLSQKCYSSSCWKRRWTKLRRKEINEIRSYDFNYIYLYQVRNTSTNENNSNINSIAFESILLSKNKNLNVL